MSGDREDRIRQRAYALWEQEGRPEGRHEHHWQQANQQAGDEMQQGTGSDDPIGRSMDHERQQQGGQSSIMNQPQQTSGGTGRDRNNDQRQHTDSRDTEVSDDVREVNLSGPTQTK